MWRVVSPVIIAAGVVFSFASLAPPVWAGSGLNIGVGSVDAERTVTHVTHRRSWRRGYRDEFREFDYHPRTREIIIERTIRTYEPAPVVVVPPPVVVYPPPVVAYPPRVVVYPPRSYPGGVYVEEVVRPTSCGVYRYWDGEGCVDARKYPPYVGPRY